MWSINKKTDSTLQGHRGERVGYSCCRIKGRNTETLLNANDLMNQCTPASSWLGASMCNELTDGHSGNIRDHFYESVQNIHWNI